MSIIDKYISREIIKFFAVVLTGAVGLYLIVEFFLRIDNFLETGLPLDRILDYFQFKLPQMIAEILPFSILMAILIPLGLMKKNNEITALKSSGMNVYFFLRPALIIGLTATILLFLWSEMVVCVTLSKANRIWWTEVKKKSAVALKQKDIWIKGYRSIHNIAYYNPQTKVVSGIKLNYFDEDFRLIKRVDAREGAFRTEKWIFRDVLVQELNNQNGNYDVSFHQERVEPVDFIPDDLKRVIKKPKEMNVKELFAYIRDVASEGYDVTIYRVDFLDKFAQPFVCIIMSIIATGIAIMGRIQKNLSISIAVGLALVFLYWVTHSFCLSLGYGGMLPPILAAWFSNVLFFLLGLFILLNAE